MVMNWGTGNVCWLAGVAIRRGGHGANRPHSLLPVQQAFCKLFWARQVVFLACSLLPRRQYHHPVADTEAGEEACGEAGCFPPNFWLGASQSEHTQIHGRRLGFRRKVPCQGLLCSLLHGEAASSLLRRACSSVMPLRWLQALPGVPTGVLLRALHSSCCLPAAKHGGERRV